MRSGHAAFGRYQGTVRDRVCAGPTLYSHQPVPLRVRNFESGKLGSTTATATRRIGAIVVWQVIDTAEAVFMVDDYENFVHISRTAAADGDQLSL